MSSSLSCPTMSTIVSPVPVFTNASTLAFSEPAWGIQPGAICIASGCVGLYSSHSIRRALNKQVEKRLLRTFINVAEQIPKVAARRIPIQVVPELVNEVNRADVASGSAYLHSLEVLTGSATAALNRINAQVPMRNVPVHLVRAVVQSVVGIVGVFEFADTRVGSIKSPLQRVEYRLHLRVYHATASAIVPARSILKSCTFTREDWSNPPRPLPGEASMLISSTLRIRKRVVLPVS